MTTVYTIFSKVCEGEPVNVLASICGRRISVRHAQLLSFKTSLCMATDVASGVGLRAGRAMREFPIASMFSRRRRRRAQCAPVRIGRAVATLIEMAREHRRTPVRAAIADLCAWGQQLG